MGDFEMRKTLRGAAMTLVATFALATPSLGESLEMMQLASDLGSVLAAEEKCDLSYDQDAIAAFIEKNVEEDDMSFPSTLRAMTGTAEWQLDDMSKSAMTAHCMQIRRVAKSYGFTN